MKRDKYPVLVTGIVTFNGKVLLGRKEEDEDHSIGGEWHFPGGFLENQERLEEAVRREMSEEASIDVEVHQIVDSYFSDVKEGIRIIFHCESDSRMIDPGDDLQDVQWVNPGELEEQIDSDDAMERDEIEVFLEKLKKMPGTV